MTEILSSISTIGIVSLICFFRKFFDTNFSGGLFQGRGYLQRHLQSIMPMVSSLSTDGKKICENMHLQ